MILTILSYFFISIGIIFILKHLINLYFSLSKFYLGKPIDIKKLYGDGWVLITGGSKGIGYQFAREFLKQNCKVALLSSNSENLKNAKNNLLQEFPDSKIYIIPYNLNNSFNDEYEINELVKKLKFIINDISVLFLNAGTIYGGYLEDIPNELVNNMLNVNVNSVVILTKIVIKFMKKRKKKSLIFGSGSGQNFYKCGLAAVYAASKAFLESFLMCLDNENENIDCTLVEFGPCETEMFPGKGPYKPKAEALAKQSMNVIGKFEYTRGHILHEIKNIIYGSCGFLWNYMRDIMRESNRKRFKKYK